MLARARVQAIDAGRLQLECAAAAGTCGTCAAGKGCALRWLAGRDPSLLEIAPPPAGQAPLSPGDGVIVEVDDGDLLRAIALAYLPPLAGLLGGALILAAVAPGRELAAVAGSAVGLAAGWGAARAGLRRFPPRYRLRIAGDA